MTKKLENKNTSVAVFESKEELQKKMKLALREIDKKLTKLNYGVNGTYKTVTNFKLNENDSNQINITTCIDLSYLIKALSFMRRIKREYYETAEDLKLEKYPVCVWLNYDISWWIDDLKMRISIIHNTELINGLIAGKKKLETFLTEEDRLSQTLTDLSKLFNK
jgi:hypothetical protein